MKSYCLNGTWNMVRVGTGETFNVSVPSDNYTELLKLGVIEDPYYKDNEKRVAWVGREDWAFERSFSLTEEDLSHRRIILCCKALDTIADVYVNEVLVGKAENAHLKYEFDVKPFVTLGENSLKIYFRAPVTLAEKLQAEKPLPPNSNGTDGIAYIRKPHCHFGWDWGPHIPLSGITDDISVLCYDARLLDFEVTQKHEEGKVKVKVNPQTEGVGEVKATIVTPSGEVLPLKNGEVEILSPELWWTRELSGKERQPLYTVRVEFEGDVLEKKIGLRTITLDRSADDYGTNFRFILNGVPIFGKGANWILPDSIMGRVTRETYDYYIDSALSANFNMLRVWGGAYYGSDYFYTACDEKGLLVWQDFMFACLMYPLYDEAFQDNVLKEVEYNVGRIKHHPSLMLWCGNNEIEESNLHVPESNPLMQSYKEFFYGTLKERIAELDGDTPFIETSPVGEAFHKSVTSDDHGDTHMWTVWHGQKPLNYYRKRLTRFCSEFGMESLPSMDAVKSFAEEKDCNILSDIFNSHQKCRNGNRKMLYYLFEKFYEPKEFRDLIYMTQLTQKECIADATEHWRRHKERCNGSVFWQYNDCWQAPSWSSVDYTGKWKALQYSARHFFEPLCVSVEDGKRDYKVYVINDLKEDRTLKVEVRLLKLDGTVLSKKVVDVSAKAHSSECVDYGKIRGNKKDLVLSVKAYDGGKLISERAKIFVPDKDLRLERVEIEKNVKYENGELKITLKAPKYCRSVMLDVDNLREPFSDNYFDLLPGEARTVTVKTSKAYASEDVTVRSLSDVAVIKSKLKNRLYRLKFFLEKQNLQMWIWYTFK